MDKGACSPGLGLGTLVSNRKEMYGGDGMMVVREVDGRWKAIDDQGDWLEDRQ